MSAPARKPLTPAQIRAIAIKRRIARADNDNGPRTTRQRAMPPKLIDDCVAAAGFDQHAGR